MFLPWRTPTQWPQLRSRSLEELTSWSTTRASTPLFSHVPSRRSILQSGVRRGQVCEIETFLDEGCNKISNKNSAKTLYARERRWNKVNKRASPSMESILVLDATGLTILALTMIFWASASLEMP